MGMDMEDRLVAKTTALELVVVALLRDRTDDPAFWDRLEKITQTMLGLPELQDRRNIDARRLADDVQDWLDTWRSIVGRDPNDPAPPGSGPFDPQRGG